MERWKIKKNQDGFRVQLHGQVYWLNNNKRNWTRFTKTMIEKHYSFVKLFWNKQAFCIMIW